MVYKTAFILGRTPAIGRAELESLYGASQLTAAGDYAVLSSLAPTDVAFARLGGTVKLASVVAAVVGHDWRAVQAELSRRAIALAQDIDEGKIQLGLSVHGLDVGARQLLAAGLELKKALRSHHYSVRLTPNQESALSSAQVLHNHLTGPRGMELLAIRSGGETVIARTIAVQDIPAYAARDQGRPKRDAFVGMLPPKLAQTIVNLATGPLTPSPEQSVLDPFCGTGVILQEAALTGYGTYGTDLEPRMIDFSQQNLAWLGERSRISQSLLEIGDATTHHWQPGFAVVASETYLGRPLSSWPKPETLRDIIGTCNVIIEKFLSNMASQTPKGLRLCLAVPAWRSPDGRLHRLPLLDHLEKMGYNRVSFEHAREEQLVYYRPEQLVARELLVITRN
ncbi:MAG TPA: DNA methyltransferase [Candidatus Saccharimonadales bacterium]